MKKVLYIQPIHAAGMDMLREKYNVVVANNEDKAFLMEAVKDASAIVTRLTDVDKDIIAAGTKLEAIAKNGIGVDNIDVAEANARGIAVLTTGHANTWSVAEHTMFAVGALYKRLTYFDNAMHDGNWKCRDEGGFTDVEGQVFGIVGLGRIGQMVAELAKAFRMEVLVFDPFLPREKIEGMGCRWAESFDELCRQADVISLHCPLTDQTKYMIDKNSIDKMKEDGTFEYEYNMKIADGWDRNQLSLVAVIGGYDADDLTNCVVENAEELHLRGILPTGINAASVTDAAETSRETYSLSGVRIDNAAAHNGVVIVKRRFADGTVKVTKQVVK